MSTIRYLSTGNPTEWEEKADFIWGPKCFSSSESFIAVYRRYELEDAQISILHVLSSWATNQWYNWVAVSRAELMYFSTTHHASVHPGGQQ